MRTFSKPCEFPYEAFIQKKIEEFFLQEGFEIDAEGQIDLIAWKGENEKWIVEAKGHTSSPRVDFNTCIGQLIGHMDSPCNQYAIAVPNTAKYIKQCNNLSDYVRKQLNLKIILVDIDGYIKIINPGSKIIGNVD